MKIPKPDKATLNIISNNGSVIWQKELAKTRDQVVADISALPSGVYSVSVQIGTNLLTTKNLIVTK